MSTTLPGQHATTDQRMQMQVDLDGRVRNLSLPRTQGLRPVFEAIVNSIDAIEERGAEGRVVVHIRRDESQMALVAGEIGVQPISVFEITDTGTGFTERNWRAFQRSDTTVKVARGGKGVGRLLFLKAFERAEVVSTYEEDGKWFTRKFTFQLPDGIVEHALTPVAATERETSVRLVAFKDNYRNASPKTTRAIATRIVEHCLERFVLGSCPEIQLSDGDETVDLWQLFEEHISTSGKPVRLSVKDQLFDLLHVFVSTSCGDGHRVYFCAQGRAVFSEALHLPDLPPSVVGPDGHTNSYYAAYISGDALDANVTPERLGFVGQNEAESLLPGDVSWQDLRSSILEQCKEFLNPYVEPIKSAKIARIRQYIEAISPQYRPLVKHRPEVLEDIPAGLKNEELEVALYRHDHAYRTDLKRKGDDLISAVREGTADKVVRFLRAGDSLAFLGDGRMEILIERRGHRSRPIQLRPSPFQAGVRRTVP